VSIWEGLSDRWRKARSLLGLAFLTWGMTQVNPNPALHGRGLAVLVGLVVGGVGWVVMALRIGGTRVQVAAMLVCGGTGAALTAVARHGLPVAYAAAACLAAGAGLGVVLAVGVTAALLTAYAVTLVFQQHQPIWLVGTAAAMLVSLLAGVVRRQQVERMEQTQLLMAETQLAREQQARAAALAERGRIAREIHDVLAHTLAALSVQLETTDALLEGGRAERARATLGRARHLAREGLTETRRAIGALRGAALPLPDLIGELIEGYTADTGATATSTVEGTARELAPDVALAVYRTAQEALTNVRKHAPGAGVRLLLCYEPDELRMEVENFGQPDPSLRPAGMPTSDGYGLTGLRERAELAGGRFEAGPLAGRPDEPRWRVAVRIPG
jgi:signal transduction histidine kinase